MMLLNSPLTPIYVSYEKSGLLLNKNSLILLSSRFNFSKETECLTNFQNYYIAPFDENNIMDLTKNKGVNYVTFMNQIKRNSLNRIVLNPFYTDSLIDYFAKNNKLPSRSTMIDGFIESSFVRDETKYTTTQQLNEDKKKLIEILKLLAVCMAMLERNYITNDEFEGLIHDKNDRKLLDYCSLWINDKNKKMFSHNLFFEYLAAKKLSILSQEDIKKIVCYGNGEFNTFWTNILMFYLNDSKNESLIDWILEIYPNFIFYLEKDKLEIERIEKLFKNVFEYYEKNKIYLPNDVYRNRNFFDFDHSENIIEYLISKLSKNNHYTTISNSLVCIGFVDRYDNNAQIIKTSLMDIATNDYYETDLKRSAIRILAQHKMLDIEEVKIIEKKNSAKDSCKLLDAYYTYFEVNGVNDENVDYFLHFLNFDDKRYNYSKLNCLKAIFINLKSEYVISKVIDYFEKSKLTEAFNNSFVENICYSIQNLKTSNSQKYNFFLKLIFLFAFNYYEEKVNIVLKFMKCDEFKLKFFEDYLNSEDLISVCGIDEIIDDECLEYLCDEYLNGKYSNRVIRDFLLYASDEDFDSYYYNKLNKLYYNQTNEDVLNIKKIDVNTESIQEKEVKEYLTLVFNKSIFASKVEEFMIKWKLDNIYNRKNIIFLKRNLKNKLDQLICDFFMRYMVEGIDILKQLNQWEWDKIILFETYFILNGDKDFILSYEQNRTITDICLNYLNHYSFKEFAENERIGKNKDYSLYYCLWYFKRKLNIDYSKEVLLDMLEIEFSSTSDVEGGIDYIIDNVSEDKVRERIIFNLKT